MEMEKAQVQRDGLRARQSDAAAQVASLRTFAQQMQSDSMDQQDLMRAAKADEDNYLLYLHKREEARIGDALDERRILNVAIVEAPVAPALAVHSLLLYFLLAFGLAMVFSVGIAFTSDILTQRFEPPKKLRAYWKCRCWLGCPRLSPRFCVLSLLASAAHRWWSSEHFP